MSARLLGLAVGLTTLIASGTYVFIYLNRWEWNRAIISGVIFVAAEVALATVFLAISSQTVDLARIADSTYRVTVQPGLGEHAQQRLTGCLQDATVDHLNGSVVSVDTAETVDALPVASGLAPSRSRRPQFGRVGAPASCRSVGSSGWEGGCRTSSVGGGRSCPAPSCSRSRPSSVR